MTDNMRQDRTPENPSFETDTTGWSDSSPPYHLNTYATPDRYADSVAVHGIYAATRYVKVGESLVEA